MTRGPYGKASGVRCRLVSVSNAFRWGRATREYLEKAPMPRIQEAFGDPATEALRHRAATSNEAVPFCAEILDGEPEALLRRAAALGGRPPRRPGGVAEGLRVAGFGSVAVLLLRPSSAGSFEISSEPNRAVVQIVCDLGDRAGVQRPLGARSDRTMPASTAAFRAAIVGVTADGQSMYRSVFAPSRWRTRALARTPGSMSRALTPIRSRSRFRAAQCETQPQVRQRWNPIDLSSHI